MALQLLMMRLSGKGFTSYTFLDACMNEKTLVDLERYAIKKPEPNRVAAKGKPRAGQATRTFFGDEDDLILFQKITQPGVKTSGYAVYQELAAEVTVLDCLDE